MLQTWHYAPGETATNGRLYGPTVDFVATTTDSPYDALSSTLSTVDSDDRNFSLTAGCRERPSLVFGARGEPIGLVTSFTPNPSKVGKSPSGSCRSVPSLLLLVLLPLPLPPLPLPPLLLLHCNRSILLRPQHR